MTNILYTCHLCFVDQRVMEMTDRHEAYFHRNSVLTDWFYGLKVGDRVSYAEEAGPD